jgi:hypothetical protein
VQDTPKVILSETGERIPTGRPGFNVVNFCSWRRLAEELHAAGNVRPDETVACFEITDRGINIYLEKR